MHRQRELVSLTERLIDAAHLCIDMQNIFARGGLWETPWMERVLPTVEAIVARYRERTIFSRFIPPHHPEDRPGRWRHYFQQWKQATRQNLRGNELDLVPEMARHVPPAFVLDKPAYSAFTRSNLHRLLTGKAVGTVVVTGAETDVCVLATALSAVDIGFRVVIVEDALCSSSDEGHDALMTMYRTRLHQQIDLINSEELFELWRPV
jgi:nicotinamidase-related amidase